MSVRRGEDDIRYLIKTMQARLSRLENQGETSRRNDVRVGDLLITWDSVGSNMVLRNLKTGGPTVTVHVP